MMLAEERSLRTGCAIVGNSVLQIHWISRCAQPYSELRFAYLLRAQLAMNEYEFILDHDRHPSPYWFSGRQQFHRGVVVAGSKVACCGDTLALLTGVLPAEGAEVVLRMLGNQIGGDSLERFNVKESLRLERQAAASAQHQALQEERIRIQQVRAQQRRARAEQVNASLCIPVRWVPAIKVVYAGLTRNSSGSGANARTVNHVMLLESLDDGRLKRRVNDLLCSGSGSYGHHPTVDIDDAGKYESEVTCAACLRVAERWKTS
jgi:hypothetical protein